MSGTSQTRQPLSVYSVMLIVSAILMLVASILMAIEMVRFGHPWENPGIPSAARTQQHFAVATLSVGSEMPSTVS